MTKNNIKTILFASLIAAMVLPFSGMNQAYAESPLDEASYALKVVNAIEPFTTLNEDGTVRLDMKSAISEGLDKQLIVDGKKIIDEQNSLVRGEISKSTILDKYFEAIPDRELNFSTTNESCEWVTGAPLQIPNILTGETTLDGAQEYLELFGFHQVAWYALHPAAQDDPTIAERDHQRSIEVYGCESGVFRDEGFIGVDYTTFVWSTPEPNPEYLDGSWEWPVWYWPLYTVYWHGTY